MSKTYRKYIESNSLCTVKVFTLLFIRGKPKCIDLPLLHKMSEQFIKLHFLGREESEPKYKDGRFLARNMF